MVGQQTKQRRGECLKGGHVQPKLWLATFLEAARIHLQWQDFTPMADVKSWEFDTT